MFKSFSGIVLILSLTAPCDDSYVIQIPQTVDLNETQSFQIIVTENNLDPDETLYIDLPDSFSLSDSHGRDDISGTLSGNHISYEAGDESARTVTIHTTELPAGDWNCDLIVTIGLEHHYPSNVLIPGTQLNQILSDIDPQSITFSNDTVSFNASYDVSLAQDASILLYIDGGDVIISNSRSEPMIANENMSGAFSGLSSLTSISDLDCVDFSQCRNISGMFSDNHLLSVIGDLEDMDTQNISDMSYLFSNCLDITTIRISNWDTSSVTDMRSMFAFCFRLKTLSLTSWDVSSVESFKDMFAGCASLTSTGNLDGWDLSECEDLSGLFDSCSKLRNIGDLSLWQTDDVTDMSKLFRNCSKLSSVGDLSGWNVENVNSFAYMFSNTAELVSFGDISLWEVSDTCEDLSYMFQNSASALPSVLDLDGWDVSNVKDMSHMFENTYTLTVLDISGWDSGNLINASSMFRFTDTGRLSPLTDIIGIGSLDTSSLKDISYIFYENQYLSCDLSAWNTDSLEDISYAFYGTYRFDIDKLKHWNVSSVLNMTETFGDNAGSLISSPVPDWYQ